MRTFAFWLLGFICGFFVGGMVEEAYAKPSLVVQDEQAITCDSWGWRDNALAASRELGARVIRVNMIEWRHGCHDEDAAVAAIAAAGMKPQLTLAGSLPYMADKVRQHGYLVNTYTVWNEPELAVFRCCRAPFIQSTKRTAPLYRKFFPRASKLIKRLDPTAKVCGGENSPFGLGGWSKDGTFKAGGWLKRFVRRHKRPVRADCWAVHPYHWLWSKEVDNPYRMALGQVKEIFRGFAKRRLLCRTERTRRAARKRCRPVPLYSTEYGQPLWDGEAGDAVAAENAYRYCAELKFKQCAQYMIFPGFNYKHSPQQWNTALTDLNCRPTATFYALRQVVTGRRGLTDIAWPECPKPIPATVPLPPEWGTPLLPPLPPVSPPEPEPVPEVLPDQPPIVEIPLPVPPLEELPIGLPGPPEPTPEPPVEPPVEPPAEPVPVDPPTEEPSP